MSEQFEYVFAEIDPETNMCISVESTSDPRQGDLPNWVAIPVYDEEYIFKYYINGNWYEDAEGTIPWTSPLA